jgi:hypothetical protein
MAPTEILAQQHFAKLVGWLAPMGVRVAWLTGSQKKKERTEMLALIESGEDSLVVGTHAVIQELVKFKNLALAIIDEQHRFGVAQRLALRDKMQEAGMEPHLLMMTATPIPRTLAMSYYADLEVSVIDELPPGRTPVVTKVIADSRRDQVIGRIQQQPGERTLPQKTPSAGVIEVVGGCPEGPVNDVVGTSAIPQQMTPAPHLGGLSGGRPAVATGAGSAEEDHPASALARMIEFGGRERGFEVMIHLVRATGPDFGKHGPHPGDVRGVAHTGHPDTDRCRRRQLGGNPGEMALQFGIRHQPQVAGTGLHPLDELQVRRRGDRHGPGSAALQTDEGRAQGEVSWGWMVAVQRRTT